MTYIHLSYISNPCNLCIKWCLNFETLLSGSLCISAPSAFKLPFNAENAEIRRGRRLREATFSPPVPTNVK